MASSSSMASPFYKRRIAIFVGITCLIALLLAPNIFTWVMRSNYEGRLSEELGLDVEIGSLGASWFTSLSVRDIHLKTQSGESVLACDLVQTEKSLLGLMLRGKDVGSIHIYSPHLRIPLEGDMRSELEEALLQIDPTQGLLRQIVNPDRAAKVRLALHDGQLEIGTSDDTEWHKLMADFNIGVNIDHTPTLDTVDAELEQTEIFLAPELSDFGLKFIAPVLAGALDLEGNGTLQISECHVQPQRWEEMTLFGNLTIAEAHADIQAKVAIALANVIRSEEDPATSPDEPLIIQIADNSAIQFDVTDGRIFHSGLRFGMTEVLPNAQLTSEGSVGFDETLDFTVGLEIPFEHMGEGPLLQKIGTPTLAIPIQGTFAEPEVRVGGGKAVGSLIRDVIRSATDDQIDPAPLLEKIGELGLLKGRRQRGEEREGNATDQSNIDAEMTPSTRPNAEEEAPEQEGTGQGGAPRRRLLDRIRDRRRTKEETDESK